MTEAPATVIVIDDDPEIRSAVDSLLRSVGFAVNLLDSVGDFLKTGRPNGPTCLVLDVRLPGQSGLDFQLELSRENIQLPIVFITGHGEISMSVTAMKAGAADFLTKPFDVDKLLEAVERAVTKDVKDRGDEGLTAGIRERVKRLTPREMEVFALVVSGMLNKQIAAELGIATILCPRAGGVLSAFGLCASERRRDTARTVMLGGNELSAERIAAEVRAMIADTGAGLAEEAEAGFAALA
jgi:FixJ family two-component response regulator